MLLGRDMVAFRDGNNSGKASVLHAFCPHMGAHLGEGGKVVDGALQCPFHLWSFNGQGACTQIPYSRSTNAPPKSTSTKAYETREMVGMVFIWFDAEDREPQWELEEHKDVQASL